jgi:hypothetical protein
VADPSKEGTKGEQHREPIEHDSRLGTKETARILGEALSMVGSLIPGGGLLRVVGAVLVLIVAVAVTAVVPLVFGLLCGLVATGIYAWQLADADLSDFFGSAAQVGIGVLVALVLDSVRPGARDALARSLHAGTVALTAVGTTWALIGVLVSGPIVSGVAFALTWGGIAAGVLGLLIFVGDPKHHAKVTATPRDKVPATSGHESSSGDPPGT